MLLSDRHIKLTKVLHLKFSVFGDVTYREAGLCYYGLFIRHFNCAYCYLPSAGEGSKTVSMET